MPSSTGPRTAMVLAAGLGLRMRPITLTMPKPLVRVAGKALIDHSLDKLAEAGVGTAVVNLHHLADALEAHLARRTKPRVAISDERAELLDTGGGVLKALPLLGGDPFFVLNSDTLWIDAEQPNLVRLAEAWEPTRMAALLMLAPTANSVGYRGAGDFHLDRDGRLRRRGNDRAPFVYAGVGILPPDLFAGLQIRPFSLNLVFDRAIATGGLYGLEMTGRWLHVGSPEAIGEAESAIAAFAG
ncbi:MAG: nucleotidyltransferase family protein [Bauldia sp.]